MKKSTVFIVFFACLAFFACNKSESEINYEYSSGVVLIKNTGYYELKINDELSAYFTNYSEEKGLENFTVDKDSIVMATSKRARQIIAGDEPLVNVKDSKPLSIAVEELNQGKIKILSDEE